MSNKETIKCDYCGKEIKRYNSQIKEHNFCSRQCLWDFNNKEKNPEGYKYRDFSKNSKRFSEMNPEWNASRMTPEVREKIRKARLNTGEGKSYEKYYGRHTHRIVAEQMLGRPLKKGEVVHHIDGDKRNNDPSNLMVFENQSEHFKWHIEHDKAGGVDDL